MYTYKAKLIRIIDGDTMEVSIDLGFKINVNKKIRLARIDTPEVFRPQSEDERIHGYLAIDFVKSIFRRNESFTIKTHKQGKYGRWITEVLLNEGNLTDILFENNFQKKENYVKNA